VLGKEEWKEVILMLLESITKVDDLKYLIDNADFIIYSRNENDDAAELTWDSQDMGLADIKAAVNRSLSNNRVKTNV